MVKNLPANAGDIRDVGRSPGEHEFEQALGIDDGQGSLACCSPWGCIKSTKLND